VVGPFQVSCITGRRLIRKAGHFIEVEGRGSELDEVFPACDGVGGPRGDVDVGRLKLGLLTPALALAAAAVGGHDVVQGRGDGVQDRRLACTVDADDHVHVRPKRKCKRLVAPEVGDLDLGELHGRRASQRTSALFAPAKAA